MLGIPQVLAIARRHPLYQAWHLSGSDLQPSTPDWDKLPTLSSRELSKAREQLRHYASPGSQLFFSSGGRGSRKVLPFSDGDLGRIADLCGRFSELEGIGPRSRTMVLLPMTLWVVGTITVAGHKRAGAEVHPVDLHGDVADWQQLCDSIRPTVISSTPSVLAAWAPFYKGPSLELVETTGEPLLETERRLIESHFGCFVHDAYGLTECVVGVECRMRQGFHYWPESVLVEILSPNTDQPVTVGDEGEIVVTSLQQESVPILRYRTGDLGALMKERCSCGREEPVLHLRGRKEESFVLPRGVMIGCDLLSETLDDSGVIARVAWKGHPSSPAAPFVENSFQPTLEIHWDAEATAVDEQCLRSSLDIAFPEMAELVHEGVLRLSLLGGGSNHV